MTDRDKLPAKASMRNLAVSGQQHSSLVERGLLAIQNATNLAQSKDNDARYRQAREVYDLITDCGGTCWFGERIGREWIPISALTEAFNTFQRLATEGYGKAYYPLSTLYGGEQSVKEDKSLAQHFSKMAFDWCLENSSQNDPEIWNDLGQRYLHEDNEQALQWFRKAAERDHAWGLYNLSGMYEFGCGVQQDWEKSLLWQIKAAEQGNLAAIFGLIYQHQNNGPDHEPDDEQALYWYRKAAEQGYPWTEADFGADRFFELGNIYGGWDNGDVEKALEHYLAAAKLGHAEAQYRLSNILLVQNEDTDSEYWLKCSSDLGFGPAQLAYAESVPEDEAQLLIEAAVEWHKAKAEAGIDVWQYEYALLLLHDDDEWCGDPEEGMRWLHAAAEQNYIPACRRLGHEYLRADVSKIATQQGLFWLSRAAELGDANACESLGDLYLLAHDGGSYAASKGCLPPIRVAPDNAVAVSWYERGVATGTPMGNHLTAFKLGEQYLTGEHLDQDLQLAEKWLRHSAEAGYSSAQHLLGDEYLSGIRFRQDTNAAIHWLELAGKTTSEARLKLAEIYLDDKFGSKNFELATKWLCGASIDGATNVAMKIIADNCFDGRFNAEEEEYAQALLDRLAHEPVTEDVIANAHRAYNYAKSYDMVLGDEEAMGSAIRWYRRAANLGHYSAKRLLKELGIDWKTP